MQNKLRNNPCSYLLLLSTAVALLFFTSCSGGGNDGDNSVRPADVRVTAVVRDDIATEIEATGTIAPNRESYLAPKVGGRIEKIFADEGDYVEADKPLLQLEQVRFRLALAEAGAAHKEARAHLKNQQARLRRTTELYDKGIADRQLHDDVLTEVRLAEARADMAASRLERAREDMKDSVLNAPFSGFVVERRMNTGESFSKQKSDYVFHLVDTSTVKVEVHIFETKKKYIVAGKKVRVSVDAVPDREYAGFITVVNPYVDPASRKFLVKIEIPNESFELESGMFARVHIPEEQHAQALLVPSAAVTERDGVQVVFRAAQNTAEQREVATGLTTHTLIEITGGLGEGDRVIIDGLYSVKDGTPINILE